MKRNWGWVGWLGGLLAMGSGQGQVLYDGSVGTLPSVQGWSFVAFPALAGETWSEGGAHLDTMTLDGISAGWSRISPSPLDRRRGFSLSLDVELFQESHVTTNRAGLSVIVLGSDKKGIELGFWTDRIWAQSDVPLFTQAESAGVEVVGGRRRMELFVGLEQYGLRLEGAPVLTGAVRDYTAFTGFIDPYETANFLFIGDNTGSARGRYRLHRVELRMAPMELPELRARRLGEGQVELRWANPTGWTGWTLEALSTLPAGRWEEIGGERTVDGDDTVTVVEAVGEQRWYRVR